MIIGASAPACQVWPGRRRVPAELLPPTLGEHVEQNVCLATSSDARPPASSLCDSIRRADVCAFEPGPAPRKGVGAGGPGRPRDYSLGLPQIRACTLMHPVRHVVDIAVPHTTGSFRGDTLVRHGVLGVVPTPRPQRGTPFAPRGPGGPFPRFNTTMGHCDFLTAFSPRFVSFAWRYHRFVPVRPQTLGPSGIIPEFAVPVAPAGLLQGDGKVSHVPVKPV